MSLFLAGYAIAQLIWGPISDKVGKPKTVLIGLSIFTIASVGIFFTESVNVLLLLRLIQAIGVCAAAVCWQALVIEKYQFGESSCYAKHNSARNLLFSKCNRFVIF
jgi:MFS family permease